MALEVDAIRLDADTWQCQLEELLALQSVYDEDFSLLAAPGVKPASNGTADGGSGGSDCGRWLDPEALLLAGPPPGLLGDEYGGGAGPSGSAAQPAAPDCFVAEALVHVDVPEGGLQLVVELPPLQQPQQQQQQQPGDRQPKAGEAAAAAAAAAAAPLHAAVGPTANGSSQRPLRHADAAPPQQHQQQQQQQQLRAGKTAAAANGGDGGVAAAANEESERGSVGQRGGDDRTRGGGGGGRGGRGRGRGRRGGGGSEDGGKTADAPLRQGPRQPNDHSWPSPSPPAQGSRGAGRGGGGGRRGEDAAAERVHELAAAAEGGEVDVDGWETVGAKRGGLRGRGRSQGRGAGDRPVRQSRDATGGGKAAAVSGRRAGGGQPAVQPAAAAVQAAAKAQAGAAVAVGNGKTVGAVVTAAAAAAAPRAVSPGPSGAAPPVNERGAGPMENGTPAVAAAGSSRDTDMPTSSPPPPFSTASAAQSTAADGGSGGAAEGTAGGAPRAAPSPVTVATAAAADIGDPTPPSPPPPPPPPASHPMLMPFGGAVQFLSPIRVTLTLPAAYPASAPPAVTLQALWLGPGQAAALVAELMAQWESGGQGGPIIFTWLDWLRGEALRQLGMRRELVLRAAAAADMVTAGASPGAASAAAAAGPEGVAVSLLRYSARREQEKFNESNICCSICLEEHLGARCVRLPDCRDAFCGPCISTHLRTQLAEGAVDNMRCPAPACRRQLPPVVLQQLLSQDEFQRWETLTLQRTLDKMEDLVYCPRCREPCLEDKDHCTLCPKCFFSFCALCEESWHPGSTCLDPETRLALIEERRKRAAEHGGGGSAMDRARKEINMQNELKSMVLLKTTARQCPQCAMGVEKVDGCNKMTCSYCGCYFCWNCVQLISGYEHFQEGKCVLFEQTEIDRWNARWQAGAERFAGEQRGMLVQMAHRMHFQARYCNCVMCGQRNMKDGNNNDIRCWSCNSHFCYLCRTWLRNKPGAHFGVGRCKQHTDD